MSDIRRFQRSTRRIQTRIDADTKSLSSEKLTVDQLLSITDTRELASPCTVVSTSIQAIEVIEANWKVELEIDALVYVYLTKWNTKAFCRDKCASCIEEQNAGIVNGTEALPAYSM
jgi:hypothetical protein